MNQQTAQSLIESPLRISREDVEQVKNMTDEELLKWWKSLVNLVNLYKCFGLRDLDHIQLIEGEFEDRPSIDKKELEAYSKEIRKLSLEYELDILEGEYSGAHQTDG